MKKQQHSINVNLCHNEGGKGDDNSDEYELLITGKITPEVPEQGPSYASGGEPAEPASAEIVSIEWKYTINAYEIKPDKSQGERLIVNMSLDLTDFYLETLRSDVLDHWCEMIVEDAPYPYERDPDEERDARMDAERDAEDSLEAVTKATLDEE